MPASTLSSASGPEKRPARRQGALRRALVDCIFVTRPLLLIPVWGFCAAGYLRGRSVYTGDFPARGTFWFADPAIFGWIVLFSLSCACVHVLNQLADIKADAANEGFPLVARGAVSRATAVVSAALCAAVSVVVPLLFGRPVLSALAAAALVLGVAYSFGPMRFSGRPVLDFLSNAIGYGGIAFGAGWYLAGADIWQLRFVEWSAPYVFLMCAGSISSTVPDMVGDRGAGKITTAVALGAMASQRIALAFLVSAGAAALFASDWMALLSAALAVPLYAASLLDTHNRKAVEASYRAGGAALMLVIAARTPLFALCALGVVIATRMYFRLRHGVVYPSFVPDSSVNA